MPDIDALLRTFRRTAGNSNAEKYFMWGAVSLWIIGGFGLVTGLFTPDPTLWSFLGAIAAYLFGRVHGKELKGPQTKS